MNFSFAGCGFLGIYHVGVAACLKKYAPNLLVNKISGASAGALAAVCLLCDCPLGTITSSVLKTATEARRTTLGPFSPTFNVEKLLREGLLSVLPDDAHERVSGKVFISVTRVSDGKNVLISHFDTREELIQTLLSSAFVPGFSGWMPPTVKGVRYVDGGFSDNLPVINDNTITVSPFCGESDICPRDTNINFLQVSLANTSIELSRENLYRFARILFPPPPEVLNKMCQQGFNDALDFLQRNNLINCTRCLAIQSRFNLSQPIEEPVPMTVPKPREDCGDCCTQRQEAILDQLPEQVGAILQDAIDSANQGLMNWVFKHRSIKLLSILTLPYVLPIDVAYAAFLKFMNSAPSTRDVKILGKQIIDLIQALIRSSGLLNTTVETHSHDSFSCQLAITEFSGEKENQMHNRHNFNFTVDLDSLENGAIEGDESILLESDALRRIALQCASRAASRPPSCAASRNVSRVASRAASRAVSRAVSRRASLTDYGDEDLSQLYQQDGQHITDDAFERVLDVTTHHEALMAYYYLDDNNEVQVTEIFDMSEMEEGHTYGGLELDKDAGGWQGYQEEHQDPPTWALNYYTQECSVSDSETSVTSAWESDPVGTSLLLNADGEYCSSRVNSEPESDQHLHTDHLPLSSSVTPCIAVE
ncbi:brummer isoform X3 [Oratosquilla oratoria]|uniref:brummer isoform X3 n=1 Tax=Oratosquilla oratoria TaxID=337810 RepID=UPI003F763132